MPEEVHFTRLPIGVPCPVQVLPGTSTTMRDGEVIPMEERTEHCEVVLGMSERGQVGRCEKHGLPLRYTKTLKRETPLDSRQYAQTAPRRPALKRGRGFSASKAQREKVKGLPCVFCGRVADGGPLQSGAKICIDCARAEAP